MFRFVHAADIHLDSPLRGLSARAGAPVAQIRSATRHALTNLVQLCIDESVDFLLIAGDLYDGDWPDFSTGHFFNQEMRRLREAKISVYLISGNHDAESKLTRELKPPENVHTFPVKAPKSLAVTGLPVTIHGQGFANPSVQENLAKSYPPATDGHFNIGLLHCSLGDSPLHGTYAPCSESDLREKQYHYWALGHIHLRDVISISPYIVYSGNPQGRHANETGPRGCYLVTVDSELTVAGHRFCELDTVRWQRAEIDLSGVTEPDDVLEKVRATFSTALSEADSRLLCLRLTFHGFTPLHGSLHKERDHWLAQITDVANDVGQDSIWLERIQIATRSPIDRTQLAAQSDLTAQVLNSLDSATFDQAPDLVADLLGRLPIAARQQLEQETPEDLGDAVSGLVLTSLSSASHEN